MIHKRSDSWFIFKCSKVQHKSHTIISSVLHFIGVIKTVGKKIEWFFLIQIWSYIDIFAFLIKKNLTPVEFYWTYWPHGSNKYFTIKHLFPKLHQEKSWNLWSISSKGYWCFEACQAQYYWAKLKVKYNMKCFNKGSQYDGERCGCLLPKSTE